MDSTDRAWFRRHPRRRYRIRPPTAAEMQNTVQPDAGQLVRIIRNAHPRAAVTIVASGMPADNDAEASRLMLDAVAVLGGVTRQ